MDATRFDAWTRRRFGLAVGGFAAALVGLVRLEDVEAKRGKKGKKPKRCKKLGTGCNPGAKRRCCGDAVCESVASLGGHRCCHNFQDAPCSSDSQCCGTLRCIGEGSSKTCIPPLL